MTENARSRRALNPPLSLTSQRAPVASVHVQKCKSSVGACHLRSSAWSSGGNDRLDGKLMGGILVWPIRNRSGPLSITHILGFIRDLPQLVALMVLIGVQF